MVKKVKDVQIAKKKENEDKEDLIDEEV